MDKLTKSITAPFENFASKLTGIFDTIGNFFEFVKTMPALIIESLKTAFQDLFLPDPALLVTRVVELRKKFGFVDSIMAFGDFLVLQLGEGLGVIPPKLTFSLSKKSGKYTFEGVPVTIDFSWYEQFKPYCDPIIAGIIWINYLWHLYSRAPDIISGAGMISNVANYDPDKVVVYKRNSYNRNKSKKGG